MKCGCGYYTIHVRVCACVFACSAWTSCHRARVWLFPLIVLAV
jgi:hypothetical protein